MFQKIFFPNMQAAFDLRSGLPIHIDKLTSENKGNFTLVCFECQSVVYLRDDGIEQKQLIHKQSVCKRDPLVIEKLLQLLKCSIICHGCQQPVTLNLNNCSIQTNYCISKKIIVDVAVLSKTVKYLLNIKHTALKGSYEFKGSDILKGKLVNYKRCIHIYKPMIDLAVELGYCVVENEWQSPTRRVALLAKPTCTYKIIKVWSLRFPRGIKHPEWVETWIDFLARKQCLRCEVFTETSLAKPYCKGCITQVAKNIPQITHKSLSRDILNTFERYFNWLLKIDTIDKYSGQCSMCKINNPFIWYYGYRSVCIECVIWSHESRFTHEGFFSSISDDLYQILGQYKN